MVRGGPILIDGRVACRPQSSAWRSASAGVASTARGTAGRGASVAGSASLSPSAAGAHGRFKPLGLTAPTTNPSLARQSAIAPCLRKRSRLMTVEPQAGGACRPNSFQLRSRPEPSKRQKKKIFQIAKGPTLLPQRHRRNLARQGLHTREGRIRIKPPQ